MLGRDEPDAADRTAAPDRPAARPEADPELLRQGSAGDGREASAWPPGTRESDADLLSRAGLALQASRVNGQGQWCRYQPDQHAVIVERMRLRGALGAGGGRRVVH